jgi:nucleotide-binding universal stress UspA family protein
VIFTNPFARIVVGYDGNGPADTALEHALALADQYGGEVVVVNVSDLAAATVLRLRTAAPAPREDYAPVLASLDGFRAGLFDKLSARVASSRVRVSLEFSTNGAVPGILDAATRWKATAIVVGTHARTGLGHALIGSMAEGVVRAALVPVIVVREGMPNKPLLRLLVGVDASEASANASVFAVALALDHPVRLVYCSIVDESSLVSPVADVPFDPTPLLAAMRASARDAIDAAVQYANAAGLYPDLEVADAPDPGTGLIQIARRHTADAVLVGTHRRGSFERFFLGSTAQSVLRRADVPVIIVPNHAPIVPGVLPLVTAETS